MKQSNDSDQATERQPGIDTPVASPHWEWREGMLTKCGMRIIGHRSGPTSMGTGPRRERGGHVRRKAQRHRERDERLLSDEPAMSYAPGEAATPSEPPNAMACDTSDCP